MKKLLYILLFLFVFLPNAFAVTRWYNATGLTGGNTGTLDSINGQNLSNGDKCIVVTASGQSYWYNIDSDSALSESSPEVIKPDSNAGDKRWILMWKGGRVIIPDSTIDQGDNSIVGTLAWHIADASANSTTVTILPGTYTISTSATVASTMTLKFVQGGILADDASNATLTINGSIEAGHYKIFDWGNGTGDITGTIGGVAEFSLKWTGATGDNSTDDTDAWNQAVTFVNAAQAMLYLPPGTYRLVPGSTDRIHRPFYGPEAVIAAHDNTDDVLLSVDTASTNTTTDPYGRYELKAIIGYDVANHSVYDDTTVVAGTGIEVVAANSSNFRIARIVGFDIAIHLDGTVIGGANGVPCSSSEWNVQEVRHNNTGLKLTAASQYNNENHTFRIRYFYDNRTAAIVAASSSVGKIQSNYFDIGALECHVTANAHGIHLSGDLTYRNTFRIISLVPPTGTGKIIVTAATAVNNTFIVPTMDWTLVDHNSQANIFDMHTSYNSDQMDVGNTPPGRSMIRGSAVPDGGYWRPGDICWNDSPEDGVLGWFVDTAGSVGSWSPIFSRPNEEITAAGACAVVGYTAVDTTAGAMAITLANGTLPGQIKEFRMKADGGNATLTIAAHETSSPEVFTFDDVGDYLVLMWGGAQWMTIKNSGVGT